MINFQFKYLIFFRSILAFLFSMFISVLFYNKILYLHSKKMIYMIDKIRYLDIYGEEKKIGIPIIGGITIIFSSIISTIFFSSLRNIYILIIILSMLWMGSIGFLDDYIKIKYKKSGINPIYKIIWQTILGIIIGSIMCFNKKINNFYEICHIKKYFFSNLYCWNILHENFWILYIPIITLIIIFFSNGSNITDGIDGLNSGISIIILFVLIAFTFIVSNNYYSNLFKVYYIPELKEIIVFLFSFIGSLLIFLWYNGYPAKIFMGDTGSLTIGAIIPIITIISKIEFILPFLCFIFLLENCSVIIQIFYFKYSKIKYGEKKKIFLMAPLHHHFQKLGLHENKIFIRFIILQLILSILILLFLIWKH